ncbi:hypothetical protein IBX73_06390 [candidate division WOR-3 bacterium]|nr:hypothetical protein [candidate division WOR-3 bacterium]
MRKYFAFAWAGTALSLIALFTGCESEGTGGAPLNLTLGGANYGQYVRLWWNEPVEGTPDSYIIYFRAIDTTDFVIGTTVSGDSLWATHNPWSMTGDYYVAARFGGTEYNSDTVTTIPVHTDILLLHELNAGGEPAYGWALTGDFSGSIYYLTNVANALLIDFYITNFTNDSAGGPWPFPWYIASPDTAANDPGGSAVPQGDWRRTWFSDPLLDPQAILPNFGPTAYFGCMSGIEDDTTYIGVYLDGEKHYGLVKFFGADTLEGTIQVESWFQTVPELRLLRH